MSKIIADMVSQVLCNLVSVSLSTVEVMAYDYIEPAGFWCTVENRRCLYLRIKEVISLPNFV